MTVIELKEKLIAKINDTENEGLLNQISLLIEFETDIIHHLTPGELATVKEAIEQIDSGLSYSNEDARNIFNKCLGK